MDETPMATADNLTDSQIETLKREAIEAGDEGMANYCQMALGEMNADCYGGVAEVKRRIAKAINAARAMEQS